MKSLVYIFIFTFLWGACARPDKVHLSGRIENEDSIVSIWVEDSIYTFSLDENNFFSGDILLKKRQYATLLFKSLLNLYLAPGEDLEIYMNAMNFSSSLNFRGSLGGINSYLKEQEVAVFFDKDSYALGEQEFVDRMKQLIEEKIQLLEAKNFDESFTALEKERIHYSIAEQVLAYPLYRRANGEENYRPGPVFSDFLSSFSLNKEELFGTKDYRAFLLNFVYLQGRQGKETDENYSDAIANYILSTITNPTIKNFLLTELVYRHILENNGLNGADYLLKVFRRECTDVNKVAYVNELISHWEKLQAGYPAPHFSVENMTGQKVTLEDYKGSYLYVTVWATWCVPCKNELPYLNLLQKEYAAKNIKFLTVAVDKPENRKIWQHFLQQHHYGGTHTFSSTEGKFNENYMVISVPRFILIAPDGTLVNSNAPRPSGSIRQLFDSLPI